MPLLALDFLAGVVTRRIDAGPLVWGFYCQAISEQRSLFLAFSISFFVRRGIPFLRPDPQYCKAGARGAVKGGRHPNLGACPGLARPHLDSFEHDGRLDAVGTTIRGGLAIGRGSSRHNLVFGRSIAT